MRYWVYINDKVDGPYEEDKLAGLDGFTPETLICSEDIEDGGSQEWVKASNIFEFDEASKTMTRAPLTQEELNKVLNRNDDINTTPSQSAPLDTSVTQILLEKLDYLTKEIEGLKDKVDAALTNAQAAQIPASAPAEQKTETVTEDSAVTDTENLLNHAEQVINQAEMSENSAEKPVDFLDEIKIGAAKTENLTEKGGEEVVLRSALDSLYNAQTPAQTEKEKDLTFQDLLSPAKTAGIGAAVGAAAGLAAATAEDEASLSNDQKNTEENPAVETQNEPQESAPQTPDVQDGDQPLAAETITEEKREEIINEITASAQQDDLVLQAIEQAQKEQLPQVQPDSAENTAQAAEGESLSRASENASEEELQLQIPVAENKADDSVPYDSPEKEALDLAEQPHLNITEDEPAEQEQAAPQQLNDSPSAVPAEVSDKITPMGPVAELEEQKEITETVKELVPGKKIEADNPGEEGLISQADLDEAFTERAPVQEFPIPAETNKPADINEETEIEAPQTQPQPQSLPEGKGFYNPNDMTEVELKEGSTYLISDFIPPAVAANASPQKNNNDLPKEYGAVPGSSEAAQAEAAGNASIQVQPVTESVEEIVPHQKTDQTDLTMSKVILENTIKTKRGATMDIKTVPMVQEPADSERLDLSDSDLDINTQHDIKVADMKPGSNKLTKMVLGVGLAVILLALIYVMLAYLELLPSQLNFIKSSPAAQDTISDSQLDEMLDTSVPQQPIQQQTLQDTSLQQPYGQNGYAPAGQTLEQDTYIPQNVQAGAVPLQAQASTGQNVANPLDPILTEVKNLRMANGQTLQQLINSRHPAAQGQIEWTITTAVEPNNYSIMAKIPPENPQSFKISHRFNYNTVTKVLLPTISDSKNLLDSIIPQAAR